MNNDIDIVNHESEDKTSIFSRYLEKIVDLNSMPK